MLGLAEHQHLVGVARGQQVHQQVALAGRVHRMGPVHDGLGDGVLRGHLDQARLAHVLDRQRLDAVLEGRREQERLALLRHPRQDPAHRRQEAHVEHPIGLVEHEHLDRVELGVATFHVVEQASRAGDQDVDAAPQVLDLGLHSRAAEDRGDVQPQVAAVVLDAFRDLHGELAGRHQHQGARLARALGRGFLRQPLQQRQAEGGRLAGAGLGGAQHVVAGQHQRDRLGLDRGGNGVAARFERAQQRGREPEGLEGPGIGHGVNSWFAACPALSVIRAAGNGFDGRPEAPGPCLRDERRAGVKGPGRPGASAAGQ